MKKAEVSWLDEKGMLLEIVTRILELVAFVKPEEKLRLLAEEVANEMAEKEKKTLKLGKPVKLVRPEETKSPWRIKCPKCEALLAPEKDEFIFAPDRPNECTICGHKFFSYNKKVRQIDATTVGIIGRTFQEFAHIFMGKAEEIWQQKLEEVI